MLRKLWNDDCGSGLLSAEWLFFFVILVLGLLAGFIAVRQALITDLTESAQALLALNFSYSFSGQSNCEASTAGVSASEFSHTIGESSTGFNNGAFISQAPCD